MSYELFDLRVTVEHIEGRSVCGMSVGDWLERDSLVCCPDPEERLVMRVERVARRSYGADELT